MPENKKNIAGTCRRRAPSPSRWQVGKQNTMILNLTPGTQSSGFAAEKADLGAPAASEAAALERDRLERRLRAAGCSASLRLLLLPSRRLALLPASEISALASPVRYSARAL